MLGNFWEKLCHSWVNGGHLAMQQSYNGHLTVEREDGKNLAPW